MGWFSRCCNRIPPEYPCPVCDSGTTPIAVSVQIYGLADGSCQNCDDLAGTYILPPVGECLYEKTFTVDLGSCGTVTFKLSYNYAIVFDDERRTLILYEGTSYARWSYTGVYAPGGSFDCTGAKTLPYTDGSASGKCAYNTNPGAATVTPIYS